MTKLEELKKAFMEKTSSNEIGYTPEMEYDPELLKEFAHIKMSHYEHGNGLDWELYEYLECIYHTNPELIQFIQYAHNHKGCLFIWLSGTKYSIICYEETDISELEWKENFYFVKPVTSERSSYEVWEIENLMRFCRDNTCSFLEIYKTNGW